MKYLCHGLSPLPAAQGRWRAGSLVLHQPIGCRGSKCSLASLHPGISGEGAPSASLAYQSKRQRGGGDMGPTSLSLRLSPNGVSKMKQPKPKPSFLNEELIRQEAIDAQKSELIEHAGDNNTTVCD
jgi:hypothetical protein